MQYTCDQCGNYHDKEATGSRVCTSCRYGISLYQDDDICPCGNDVIEDRMQGLCNECISDMHDDDCEYY